MGPGFPTPPTTYGRTVGPWGAARPLGGPGDAMPTASPGTGLSRLGALATRLPPPSGVTGSGEGIDTLRQLQPPPAAAAPPLAAAAPDYGRVADLGQPPELGRTLDLSYSQAARDMLPRMAGGLQRLQPRHLRGRQMGASRLERGGFGR